LRVSQTETESHRRELEEFRVEYERGRKELEAIRNDARGLADDELAWHLLNICLLDLQVIVMEIRRERGPGFVKARERHAAVLSVLIDSSRLHYARDKELLRRLDSEDRSGAQAKYIALKERMLATCEQALVILSKNVDKDSSMVSIQEAGKLLQDCVDALQRELDSFPLGNHNS
jgi:hypothetical protein